MEIKYQDIPSGWALCFLTQCPRKNLCLRYQAGSVVPATVRTCETVVPTVLQHDACPMYLKNEPMRMAVGFSHIFDEVKQRHAHEMRARLAVYLGGNGTYYRYLHGQRALTPVQQQWIARLFAQFGYPDSITYDAYESRFSFYDT